MKLWLKIVRMLCLGLLCGGCAPEGYRQIATGSGLQIEFDGAMSGSLLIAPATAAELDSTMGQYYPQPPFPTPAQGAWIAERTVSEGEDISGVWHLQANAADSSGLVWQGSCGQPRTDDRVPLSVLVFSDPASASVSVSVYLSGEGTASFEASTERPAAADTELIAHGVWSVDCYDTPPENSSEPAKPGAQAQSTAIIAAQTVAAGSKTPIGPGTVRLRYSIDFDTLRFWEAPRRQAF